MANQQENYPDESTSELKSEKDLTSEEFFEPIMRNKWQYVFIQLAFLLSGILLFVIINYIFGFMKGN